MELHCSFHLSSIGGLQLNTLGLDYFALHVAENSMTLPHSARISRQRMHTVLQRAVGDNDVWCVGEIIVRGEG